MTHEEQAMKTEAKPLGIVAMLGAAPLLTLSASRAGVEKSQSANGGTVTTIRTNGRFAEATPHDGDSDGFLSVSRDRITGTTALVFSYATREPDGNTAVLLQGAGEIPNGAFTNA